MRNPPTHPPIASIFFSLTSIEAIESWNLVGVMLEIVWKVSLGYLKGILSLFLLLLRKLGSLNLVGVLCVSGLYEEGVWKAEWFFCGAGGAGGTRQVMIPETAFDQTACF